MLLALLAAPAGAATVDAGLSVEYAHYSSVEHKTDGSVFDTEHGQLAGLHAQLQSQRGAWHGLLDATWLRGNVAYLGQTQIGIPLATSSHLDLATLGAELAWQPTAMLLLGLRAQHRDIDRGIRASVISGALDERLQRYEFGPMARIELPACGPVLVALQAQYLRSYQSHLDVDPHGSFDNTRLALDEKPATEIRLDTRWPVSTKLAVTADVIRQYYRAGSSDIRLSYSGGHPYGVVSYPGSRQGTWSMRVGLAASF